MAHALPLEAVQTEMRGHPSGVLLPMSPPHYLDPQTGECGVAEAGVPSNVLPLLYRSPEILAEHSGAICEKLRELLRVQ